jgi:hypothetical protein
MRSRCRPEHVERLERIKRLQAEGKTLVDISRVLGAPSPTGKLGRRFAFELLDDRGVWVPAYLPHFQALAAVNVARLTSFHRSQHLSDGRAIVIGYGDRVSNRGASAPVPASILTHEQMYVAADFVCGHTLLILWFHDQLPDVFKDELLC